jgi:hypothetical protein
MPSQLFCIAKTGLIDRLMHSVEPPPSITGDFYLDRQLTEHLITDDCLQIDFIVLIIPENTFFVAK